MQQVANDFAQIGLTYNSKAELLADVDRFAKERKFAE